MIELLVERDLSGQVETKKDTKTFDGTRLLRKAAENCNVFEYLSVFRAILVAQGPDAMGPDTLLEHLIILHNCFNVDQVDFRDVEYLLNQMIKSSLVDCSHGGVLDFDEHRSKQVQWNPTIEAIIEIYFFTIRPTIDGQSVAQSKYEAFMSFIWTENMPTMSFSSSFPHPHGMIWGLFFFFGSNLAYKILI